MKGLIIRLCFLGTTFLLCFALAELLGRQGLSYVARNSVSAFSGMLEADPELLVEYTSRGRRLVPNADVIIHNHYISGLDVDVSTNSIGLRDIERTARPAEKTERVLLLGDSIIAQDYLPSQKTISHMLEQALDQTSSVKVEVINAGLSNTGLEEQQQILSEIIGRLNPTVVLLSFYLNDSRPAWGFSGEIGNQRGWLRKHSIVIETLVRELEVRRWLSESKVDRFGWLPLSDRLPWKSDRMAFQKLIEAAPYDWGSAWNDDSWAGVEKLLSSLRKLVEKNGARLGVVAMPISYQVQADFLEDQPQRMLKSILDKHEIPFLSVLPVEREHRAEEIFYDWCHPNERGNVIMLPVISDFVSQQLFKK